MTEPVAFSMPDRIGWTFERLKNRVRLAYGHSLAAEHRNSGEIPVFGSNGLVGLHDQAITNGPTVIVGRKGSFGKVTWSEGPCFPIDTTYFVDSTQTKDNLRWVYYTLVNLGLDTVNFDSAVPGLSREIAYSLRINCPGGPEQQRIAAYLDSSCAALDAAVTAKRHQIETLDAVRKSAIESAVTQGIGCGTPFRRIDEDWIGDIPSHWKVSRIKRIVSRVDYGISQTTEREGRIPVLKMGHIQRGEVDFSDLEFVDEVPENLLLQKDDLLYNRTNSPDQVGKAAIFRRDRNEAVTFASYLVRLRTNHRTNPNFLNYVLNSDGFLGFARKLAIPSVQQSNLNSTRYCRMHVPLPPLPEQEAIAEFLDAKLGDMQRVVTVIEQQIDTLVAYRKSLIHECVTGQQRVTTADVQRVMMAAG